ncbi:MAG: hypothetical protein ACOCUA_01285 [archaeon]
MSISGLCQICEAAEASHRCDRCGNLVCDDHFEATRGYCVDCVRQIGGEDESGDVHKF